ncbi:ankyrin repeat domain-containing protein 40-like [Periplaneta americana]|uniref:Ankyrin repeat domain-containing protein 40 n=1 Tax=Periplaneta americana TaxID=6978 RepID=A0ABQ8TDP2_PERAM|nr:hypothetical protein ANN_06160 [Periplaneta americana]
MDRSKALEENLREASCIGDVEGVEELINKGVNVNAKHDINGWTPLHWAAKRGHKAIVSLLLANGADTTTVTAKGETPASLCGNSEVRKLLGMEPGGTTGTSDSNPNLPITPYYLKHQPLNGRVDLGSSSSSSSVRRNTDMSHTNSTPVTSPAMKTTPQTGISAQNDELVLKVRIANSIDPDFIEVEIPRTELSYSRLLRVCCEELGISANQIIRVRKLPDTLVRKDKDVQRFRDFQEIEIVIATPSGKNKLIPGSNGLIAGAGIGGANLNGYQSISLYKNQTILY